MIYVINIKKLINILLRLLIESEQQTVQKITTSYLSELDTAPIWAKHQKKKKKYCLFITV